MTRDPWDINERSLTHAKWEIIVKRKKISARNASEMPDPEAGVKPRPVFVEVKMKMKKNKKKKKRQKKKKHSLAQSR